MNVQDATHPPAAASAPDASAHGSLRQRKKGTSPAPAAASSADSQEEISALAKAKARAKQPGELDYYVGFAVVTALGFLTRFWGIGHPDQVVFDEVHFGKVGQVADFGWGNR